MSRRKPRAPRLDQAQLSAGGAPALQRPELLDGFARHLRALNWTLALFGWSALDSEGLLFPSPAARLLHATARHFSLRGFPALPRGRRLKARASLAVTIHMEPTF